MKNIKWDYWDKVIKWAVRGAVTVFAFTFFALLILAFAMTLQVISS